MSCCIFPAHKYYVSASLRWIRCARTLGLLRLVAGDRADDGVLLAGDAVGGALDVALGLRGVVLGLALGVLLLPGLLPRGRTGEVADLQAGEWGCGCGCGVLTVSLMVPLTEWNWPVVLLWTSGDESGPWEEGEHVLGFLGSHV